MPPNPLSRWGRRWARWRALPAADRSLLLHFAATLPLCTLSLRLLSLRRTLNLLTTFTRHRVPSPALAESPQTVEALRHAAQMLTLAASALPVHTTCLHRSVTLWWYCHRRGIACDLRLGVRPTGAAFQAHAWVEYRGAVINDDPSTPLRFAPFAPTDRLRSSTYFD